MRGGTETGYTIVETMIFLAISGLMFIMAAVFISGKQGKAEFKQGLNDINTQVQQVISDVSNGFYPSQNNFACSAGPTGSLTIDGSGSGTAQGQNIGCTFLGKVIQFGADADPTAYNVFTVAGRQFSQQSNSTTDAPIDFSDADPQVVDNATFAPKPTPTQKGVLEFGLDVTSMWSTPATGTATPIDAIGFFGSFTGKSGGTLASGSQSVNVVTFTGGEVQNPPPSETTPLMIGDINKKLDAPSGGSPLEIANPNILICFDGPAGQYGALSLGNGGGGVNGQRLTTSIQTYTDVNSWNTAGCK